MIIVWLPERQFEYLAIDNNANDGGSKQSVGQCLLAHMFPLTIRIVLIINYTLGYACAGQAQGVSSLLTSEKDE